MASIIKRLWSGSDFWDKEENKQQRQQYAAPRPQPEMEQKIKTARYGVLANSPQRQQQFIQDTKATPGPSILSTVHNAINDTLNANTQADQQRRLSQGLPRYYQDQSNLSKITRAAETGGRVTARVLQGIGQDTLGTYDLLTPGHGINRATKYYQNRGAQTDQEVKDMGLDENVYKAGQVPLALGSYMIPGKAVSNIGKIPRVAKAATVLSKGMNKVPGLTKAVGTLDDLAANGDRFQRITANLARSYTRPGNIADVGVDALQNAGHRTSLGQDNSAGTLALDVGMSLGMQGGMNLAGQGASAGIRAANAGIVQPTTRLVRNVANTVAPVQTTTKLIPRTGRLDLATSDALKAYSNMLVGADPNITGKVQSDLIARIQQIGKENGVDLTNGSVEQRMARVEAMLNGYLPQTQTGRQFVGKPLGEATGSVPIGSPLIPIPKKLQNKLSGADPLESLKQEAKLRPDTIPNIPRGKQVADAIESSTGQKTVGKVGGKEFELGSFGEKNSSRKSLSEDRFDAKELTETIANIKRAYKASDNPKSYRKDNVAWVADMPNGEKRVVYTRLNKSGKEEVINWHKIQKEPNYENSLAAFGDPARSRTESAGLERLRGVRPTESSTSVTNKTTSVNPTPNKLAPVNMRPDALERVFAMNPDAPVRNELPRVVSQTADAPVARPASLGDMPETVAQKSQGNTQISEPRQQASTNIQTDPKNIEVSSKDSPSLNNTPQNNPVVRKFVADYAKTLKQMDDGARGGQLVKNLDGSSRRTSEHSDFYRNFMAVNKKKPTMKDWIAEASEQLESGKAGFGASDEYKKLTGAKPVKPKNTEKPKPVKSDPLESLKQEARYYHGSTNDKLTSLQPGAKTGLNEKRNLIYLTDDAETAKPYTKNRGTNGSGQGVLTDSKTGKVYEVQVEGNTIGAYDFEELAKLKTAKGFDQLSGKTKNAITNDTGLSAGVLESNAELRNFLTENGYTNVKAHLPNGTGKSSEIIVLDPSKAKLSQPPKSPPVQKVETKELKKQVADADAKMNKAKTVGEMQQAQMEADNLQRKIARMEGRTDKNGNLIDDTPATDVGAYFNPKKTTSFEKDLQAVGLAPSSQAKGSVGTPSRSTPKKPQRLEVPSGQTTELPRLRQSKANPANQPSNRNEVLSKETPVNAVDSTTNAPDSKDWGRLMLQADEETQFNAVAGAAGTKNATKLTEAINNDAKITKAAIEAQRTGKELNFFAKKDANDRSVGIEQFDPDTHRIEAGMVVDNKGNVVGNHIKVDETGIQVNVGGELVNMGKVLGKPDQWKGKYRVTETMSRNIDRNAPNKEIAQKAKDFLIGGKTKAEANYRTELDLEYKKLGNRIKTTNKAKPRGVSKQQWEEDIFDTLDGKKSDVDIRASYDKSAADAILNYKKETRTLYDSLLERINTERVKFGQAPVEGRKDYITHLSELAGNKSFAGEVYSSVRNSFTDEGMQKTRNGVPGEIAGRSENFKPLSAWNRFMQRRTGDKAVKDPFNAVQAYLEPALYNIHMTESTVRARAIESAFRTAGELQKMKQTDVAKIAGDVLKPYMNGDNGKLVAGFQEYANALAKKTQRWDRQIIDASDASATALKGWQGLQRVGGRATILGNVSSTLSQVLGQPIALADAGVGNYLKGVAKSLGGDNAILQSDFIKARKTKAVAPIRGKGQKILDAGGVPLEKVELASVELVWNTQHAKATAQGYTGKKAVQMADYNTERLVAGRGIADRPEAYRSTMSSGLLQYTLEVSAQNKAFWKDLSVSQKATFMVAALGANSLFGAVTGFKPLPDFLGAAIDTTKDFANTDDERSAGEKALGGVQRGASEAISMNPIASAFVNTALSQDQRRSLFGKDSDLGRFEGTAAPIQVIKNSYRAGKSALDGNLADARNSALKTVPFGNQIRKTWTGAEANARGYAVDRNGKKTFETGKNVYEQAQNLLFGTSSTKSAQAYYSGDSKKKTELRQIGTTTTKDEKGNYTARDKYDTLIDAYKKNKDGTIGVNDYDTNDLRNTIKQVGGDLNKELKAAGLREIKADSRHAVDYAKYKKSLAGKDELEVEEARKDFYRDTYKSQLDKRTQAFYKLSDGKMRDAINSGKVTKEQLQKAIETDNYLTEKGLQPYLQIGKTLRRELGYAAPGGRGNSGRKSGGRGGKRKAIPKDLMAKAMDVPKVAQLRQSKITAKQPQARSFKTRRKAIPKIAKSTPKLTVKRTQTA